MRNRMQPGYDLFFVIQERDRGRDAKQAFITPDVIERMIRKCQFKMSIIRVELSTQLAITEISLRFGPDDNYPISRFPRSLLQDEGSRESQYHSPFWSPRRLLTILRSPAEHRQSSAVTSNRWAGRSPSQQKRPQKWDSPDMPQQRQYYDRIAHYSKPDYLIGDSTQVMLRRIANRLINGPSPMPELASSGPELDMAGMVGLRSELWVNLGPFELDATSTAVVHSGNHDRADSASRVSPSPPPIAFPTTRDDIYKALFDFAGLNSNELTLMKDEIVQVLKTERGNSSTVVVPFSSIDETYRLVFCQKIQ